MKILLSSIIALALLSGCSYKNEAIGLKPYQGSYKGEKLGTPKEITLVSVQDSRSDKQMIGSIMENDKKITSLFSDVDFAKRYERGLQDALKIAGFTLGNEGKRVSVAIEKIDLVYMDKSFDENLKGEMVIAITIQEGDVTTTQKVKQKAGKWIAPSHSSKDLEPFLHELFSNSIDEVVAKLTAI